LTLRPESVGDVEFDHTEIVPSVPPARALDHALERVAARDGEPTARFVALQLEYPWR